MMYQIDWGILVVQFWVDGSQFYNFFMVGLQIGDNKLFGSFFFFGD